MPDIVLDVGFKNKYFSGGDPCWAPGGLSYFHPSPKTKRVVSVNFYIANFLGFSTTFDHIFLKLNWFNLYEGNQNQMPHSEVRNLF